MWRRRKKQGEKTKKDPKGKEAPTKFNEKKVFMSQKESE